MMGGGGVGMDGDGDFLAAQGGKVGVDTTAAEGRL